MLQPNSRVESAWPNGQTTPITGSCREGVPGQLGFEDCKGPDDIPQALGVKFVGVDGGQLAQQPEVWVALEVLCLSGPWQL